jgi:hypothetical protein
MWPELCEADRPMDRVEFTIISFTFCVLLTPLPGTKLYAQTRLYAQMEGEGIFPFSFDKQCSRRRREAAPQ